MYTSDNYLKASSKMIVTFCGHRNFVRTAELEEKLDRILLKLIKEHNVTFYLGGYGDFDMYVLEHLKNLKEKMNFETAFITPYITESYQKNRLEEITGDYDLIIYPPIEKAPLKFAIEYRNKWMIEESDIVIAYVKHSGGGAAKSLKHAVRRKKRIYNLALDKIEL